MGGNAEDKNRNKLLESILETIAKDTPKEAVMSEVELLSTIQLFPRSDTEKVPEFVGWYEGAIARRMRHTDPNQMLNDGAPTSTGGIINETRISDALIRTLKIRAPQEKYIRSGLNGGQYHKVDLGSTF